MSSSRIRWSLVAAAFCAGLLVAGPTASAGRRGPAPYHGHARMRIMLVPAGLYVGAGLVGARILDQRGGSGELLDSGGGVTLFGGLRLSQRLALELGWLATFHNPETIETNFGPDTDYLVLNGFTGDAKIFLGSGGVAEPYAQGGVGLYLLDSTYLGTQSVGTGFQAGGGFDFHLAPSIDLGIRALYRGIAMGPPDARSSDEDTFVSALTAEGNITIRF